jgi:hypothetical protein
LEDVVQDGLKVRPIEPKEIYEYYASQEFNPVLPLAIGFRHFRFKQANGCWRKAPYKITDKDDLIKWIVMLGGCDIYYGVSHWLNPHKVSSKAGRLQGSYHIADNLILNSDLVFDIDAKEPITADSLEIARKSASNIYETMRCYSWRFEFEYAAYTGYKGFRLSYIDKSLELPHDPRKRIQYIEDDRKVFIDCLLENIKENRSKPQFYKVKTTFDKKVTENVLAVVRVIGTVHSTTGYISTVLPPSMLRKPIRAILDHIPYIGKVRPVIPEREMKRADEITSPRSRLLQSAKDVPGLASLPPNQYKYYFTNKVLGIKRGFIPVFVYQKIQGYYKKEVVSLQQKYNLGPLYLLCEGDQYIVLSLKTMQRRQLQKLLNKSTSKTKYGFIKNRRIFVPYFAEFLEKIPSKFTGNLSLGHQLLLDPDFEIKPGINCGWDKIEMIQANMGPE